VSRKPLISLTNPPGDRRLGQAWTARQQHKNDLLFHAATWLVASLGRTPRALRPALGWALGTLVWAGWSRGRRAVASGLRRADVVGLGPHRVFVGLGDLVTDIVALTRPGAACSDGWTLDPTSQACLEDALHAGRGVIFVTAHLGGWERMAGALAERGYPITTLARASYDPRFHALYDRVRGDRGVGVIYRGSAGAEFATTRAILRGLRQGRVIGFPMDIGGRGVRAVDVPFLGALRPLPVGPATLALRTGAALVVGSPTRPVRDGAGITIERVPDQAEDGTPWTEVALTAALARRLEARIRALPTEWPWMLVAEAGPGPLLSRPTQEISCETNSTPPFPDPTHAAMSARSR
jgi:Kdo2-lipid IVA lauroyltransferase/acyltransferase